MRTANPEGTTYQDKGCVYFPRKIKSCAKCPFACCLDDLEVPEKREALAKGATKARQICLLRNKSSGGI